MTIKCQIFVIIIDSDQYCSTYLSLGPPVSMITTLAGRQIHIYRDSDVVDILILFILQFMIDVLHFCRLLFLFIFIF